MTMEEVNTSPVKEANKTDEETPEQHHSKSLCIPISNTNEFIEIFPEEISDVKSSELADILQDEKAPLPLWADAALLFMTQKRERDSTILLSTACSELLEKQNLGNKEERTRILAAAGIGYLTQANKSGTLGTLSFPSLSGISTGASDRTAQQRDATDQNEELRVLADNHFTRASKLNQLFPMTWIGRGMLNLSIERFDQAKFFFETTLKHCGMVLPALLGMACVCFKEGDYKGSLKKYSEAITLFPTKSGAAARVGLGLACYELGQVDRAKKSFERAHAMDPKNVEAMVGIAVLDVANLDEGLSSLDSSSMKEYRKTADNAMRLISMANHVDHSNAMVQNHLANYFFQNWTPVSGVTVSLKKGSVVVDGNGSINLDAGDRIRIGYDFETNIVGDDDDDMMDDDNMTFKVKDTWKAESADGLKLWKKDYDRVIALAKGAYSSTTVEGIQAESLYILARVYHVRDDMENANKFYDRACKLFPDLSPARFGLAQTLIWDETYDEAVGQLRIVVGKSPSATDAQATLGLLEVKSGDRTKGFSYLTKAIDLEPANADLVLLEALALQQQESDYHLSLERYQKAVQLMESQGESIPWVVLTNMGVLCHETKKFDDAASCYEKALLSLESNDDIDAAKSTLDTEDDKIHHADNLLFWNFVETGVKCDLVGSDDSKVTWKLDSECSALKAGDLIRLGDSFESEIETIDGQDLKLKKEYSSKKTNEEGMADDTKMDIFVRRTNGRLGNPHAISITFNLARLHESAGRTVAAVELHKAIVKRHPSYVNSYLRLACIARDFGSLANCSEWLKSACAVAPGNPEVLTLVGNLHLSLCDWKPAQAVFDQLLEQKIPNVQAYSMLCLGNIYFNNLKTPDRYAKHLQYAADFYRRILTKDNANAFAANGIGTVLAEKAELIKAKEIFDQVRGTSGDSIPDALLNLGHINLALNKHPEALQMYNSFMERTRNSDAPITSKSQNEDEVEVLQYIAFAYFDWARQSEACNNAKAAPADGYYRKCIEYIEIAIKKSRKENLTLRYNWCMAKLAAANCVLQKLTRGIRRTASEVKEALDGLQESLPKVEMMLKWKDEGKKVPVSSSLMKNFETQCKANIESAKSHLSEEIKKEAEASELRELQQMEAMAKQKELELAELERKERTAKEQEEIEMKARMKMEKVNTLVEGWEHDAYIAKQEAQAKKTKKDGGRSSDPQAEEEDENMGIDRGKLFDDSSDEEDNNKENENGSATKNHLETSIENQTKNLFGDSDDDDEDEDEDDNKDKEENKDVQEDVDKTSETPQPAVTGQDLFGDDSSSDEELLPGKRGNEEANNDDDEDAAPSKKRKVDDENS